MLLTSSVLALREYLGIFFIILFSFWFCSFSYDGNWGVNPKKIKTEVDAEISYDFNDLCFDLLYNNKNNKFVINKETSDLLQYLLNDEQIGSLLLIWLVASFTQHFSITAKIEVMLGTFFEKQSKNKKESVLSQALFDLNSKLLSFSIPKELRLSLFKGDMLKNFLTFVYSLVWRNKTIPKNTFDFWALTVDSSQKVSSLIPVIKEEINNELNEKKVGYAFLSIPFALILTCLLHFFLLMGFS